MPTTVEIPDVGQVEFPDSMSHDDIKATIKRKFYLEPAIKTSVDTAVSITQQITKTLVAGAEGSEMGRQQLADERAFLKSIGQEGHPPQNALERAARNWQQAGFATAPTNVKEAEVGGTKFGATEGVQLPRVTPPPDAGTTKKVAAGLYNVGISIPNFVFSIEGLATMLAPEVLPVQYAKPLLTGLFAGLMAKSTGEAVGKASVTKDPQDITEAIGNGVMTGVIGYHGAIDAIDSARKEAGEKPVEPPIRNLIKSLVDNVQGKKQKDAALSKLRDVAPNTATAVEQGRAAAEVGFLQQGTGDLSQRPFVKGQELPPEEPMAGAAAPGTSGPLQPGDGPRAAPGGQFLERITGASYTHPKTGEVSTGEDHPEAAAKQGVQAALVPEHRHGPEYGFEVINPETGKKRIVSRDEAEAIARLNGQLLEEPKRGKLHSDEVQFFKPLTPDQQDKLRDLGLKQEDVDDLQANKIGVTELVSRKLPTQNRGPDHAKVLEEARLQARVDIENILAEKGKPDASEVSQAAEVHGDVRPQPIGGERKVSEPQSGAGVQPQTEGGLPEAQKPEAPTKQDAVKSPAENFLSLANKIAVRKIDRIIGMDQSAFENHKKSLQGKTSLQADAHLTGAALTDRADLEKLRKAKEQVRAQYETIQKQAKEELTKGDADKGMSLMNDALQLMSGKGQWISEAIEGATGSADATKTKLIKADVGENYKAPFPESDAPKIAEAKAKQAVTQEQKDQLRTELGLNPDQIEELLGASSLSADGSRLVIDFKKFDRIASAALEAKGIDISKSLTVDEEGMLSHESAVSAGIEEAHARAEEILNPEGGEGVAKLAAPPTAEPKARSTRAINKDIQAEPDKISEPEATEVKPEASAPALEQKYRIGTNPQTYTLLERLTPSEIELQNSEQPVRVRNDKTGKDEVVMEDSLTPVKQRSAAEKAAAKPKSVKELDAELRKQGMDPSVFKNSAEKKAALERAKEKLKGIAASVRSKWTSATDNRQGESGFINIDPIKDLVDKATPYVRSAFAWIREAGKEAGTIAKTTDYRRAVLNWSSKLQKSFSEAAAAQSEIMGRVKDPARRDGIINWIQADGDVGVLAQRRAATESWVNPTTGKPHPMKARIVKGYDAAMNLTPEEIQVAQEVKAAYDDLLNRGLLYGVIKSFKDNYVTQIWDLGKSQRGTGGTRTLRDKFRFSKASTFDNYFQGEQAGYVPKDKDIAKVLPVYLHEMNSVIAARQLAEELSNGVASDGRPLVQMKGSGSSVDGPQGQATLISPKSVKEGAEDYKVIPNQPALTDWIWAAKDPEGNPVFMKADMALHPEAYQKLKNVLGKSAIAEWYSSKTSTLAEIPKKIIQGIDIGNAQTKRTMLGFFAPFHQVQEGTHGLGHRTNPFFGIPQIDLTNDAGQADAIKHGLMLAPDRLSANQFMEGFKTAGLISYIPFVGPAADFYSTYLFHQYIPGLKFKTYENILSRNRELYFKEIGSGKASLEDVKILSAEQANAAYGHLNYADLARNPTVMHLMRLGLLAPDFFEARARFTGQAAKGVVGKVGHEQLMALATLAIGQAALAFTAAKLTGGQWDEKHPFEFHTGSRRYTIRSVPEDISSLLNDTRMFVHSRISPIIGKGTLQYLSGVDWRGQKVSSAETTKDLLQQPIPLWLRGFFGLGNQSLATWEQIASSAGLRISRYSYVNETHKLAEDWMKNSKDPKVQARYDTLKKTTFPESDYKPLRDALILNNNAKAKAEYEKLLKSKTRNQVNTAMHVSRAFTLNKQTDREFFNSLDDEQKTIFLKAVHEREDLYRKFQIMKFGNAKQDPEDVLGEKE